MTPPHHQSIICKRLLGICNISQQWPWVVGIQDEDSGQMKPLSEGRKDKPNDFQLLFLFSQPCSQVHPLPFAERKHNSRVSVPLPPAFSLAPFLPAPQHPVFLLTVTDLRWHPFQASSSLARRAPGSVCLSSASSVTRRRCGRRKMEEATSQVSSYSNAVSHPGNVRSPSHRADIATEATHPNTNVRWCVSLT